MKVNQLISDFTIYTTNEEKEVLESFDGVRSMSAFEERQQVHIESLCRKSLISKVRTKHGVWVQKNEI